jgi:hypothetical protein
VVYVKGIARTFNCWYLTSCCGLEVQKPTQALKSVIGPGNIFDWNPMRARTLPSLIYFSSSWPIGVYVNGIARTFNWLKCLGGFLHLKPTAGCQISTLIFEKKIMEGGLYKYPMKNILWTAKFLTTCGLCQRYCPGLSSCCGLEVQKPTQALKSVIGPGNIFDWNPMRARTLPSLIYFSWDIYREPWKGVSINIPWKIYYGRQSSWPLVVYVKGIARDFNWLKCLGGFLHLHKKNKFKYQSWYLTLCCGLEVQKPTQALKSVKGPENTFDWSPNWARTLPSNINFDIWFFLWRGVCINIPWTIY